MQIKIPKKGNYQWMRHAMYKMQHYGLSPQKITRVIEIKDGHGPIFKPVKIHGLNFQKWDIIKL